MASSANTRRILSLWLRRLPTDRIKRQRKNSAARADIPLVLVAKTDNNLRLSAIDAKAARLGLHVGQPLANARAMIPSLEVIEADEPADLALLNHIADWCDRFTPFVALDPPHGLLLDVTGASHLFGGERGLLENLHAGLSQQGFTVQLALAGSAVAARALSHYAPNTLVPPGEEARAIAPLPVAALQLDPAIVHGLRRAGLKTIGQAGERTRRELTARFGAELVWILDRAFGKDEKPISPRMPLPDYMAEHRFAEPIVTEDVIAATIHALAVRLAHVLQERGQGARLLQTVFFRTDGQVRRIAVETGKPISDPAVIDRLFREKLDALADPLDPGFGFDLIRLEAIHAERPAAHVVSLDESVSAERDVEFLIDRLAARFGAHRVLRFVPQDTHIPEAAAPALSAQHHGPAKTVWRAMRGAEEAPRRPLRLFARPEPIEVMAEVPEGPPLRFRWRRALHGVARAEGPERIAMEWWRSEERLPTRDYFRIEDQDGRRFWLYRDGLYGRETGSPRWYVHGLFA